VYVPAETRAVVRLEGQLDTSTSSAGDPFVARLVEPLRAVDGHVLAPAGARVDGHVAAIVLGGPRTELRLAFDRIETVHGVVPLAARVVSAQYNAVPGGGRREPTGAFVRRAERVVVPAGSTIVLALARPLVLGAR
jgi:hypothetical protein